MTILLCCVPKSQNARVWEPRGKGGSVHTISSPLRELCSSSCYFSLCGSRGPISHWRNTSTRAHTGPVTLQAMAATWSLWAPGSKGPAGKERRHPRGRGTDLACQQEVGLLPLKEPEECAQHPADLLAPPREFPCPVWWYMDENSGPDLGYFRSGQCLCPYHWREASSHAAKGEGNLEWAQRKGTATISCSLETGCIERYFVPPILLVQVFQEKRRAGISENFPPARKEGRVSFELEVRLN